MKTIVTLSLVLVLLIIAPLANSSAFSGSDTYETVYVKPGDTVWRIAANYVTAKEDIREKVFFIRQVNKLDNNAHLYPGQALKVPVNR
ncbi:MAG: yneA [Sporomusa sp.]|jgi:LysM repeat protein|nr:yneA [Sporomusa sp.]